MVDGKRGKSDGCVIIGSQGQKEGNSEGPVNDFSICYEENGGPSKRHMIIKYSIVIIKILNLYLKAFVIFCCNSRFYCDLKNNKFFN